MLFLLSLFISLFFVIQDIGIRYLYSYILLGVVWFGCLLFSNRKVVFSKEKGIFLVIPIAQCFFLFLPNSYQDKESISLTISLFIFTLFVLFSITDKNEISIVIKIVRIVAALFALYLVVTKIKISFYWDKVFPHLSEYVQSQAKELIPLGYGVPIGGSATYADYVMALAFFSCYGILWYPSKCTKGKYIINLGLLFVFLLGIVIANRKSEIVALVCSGFILFLLSINHKKGYDFAKKAIICSFALLAVGLLLVVLSKMGYLDRYISFFENILSDGSNKGDIATSGRFSLWTKAWDLGKEHPVLGIGWRKFIINNTYQHDVHNTYLQWFCETGVLGFCLFMIPSVYYLISSIKTNASVLKNTEKYLDVFDIEVSYLYTGMFIFFFVLNMIDPAFYHLNYFCFFSFIIILLGYQKRVIHGSES